MDYSSFGSLIPNRHASFDGYRYGFNGKEKDDEVKGEGVQYDYGFRIYDGRIGRFLSRDPLSKSFPWYTPYQFAGNKPIHCVDLDGLEELFFVTYTEKIIFGSNYIERTTNGFIERAVNDAGAIAISLKTSIEDFLDPRNSTLTTVNPNAALENMERQLQKVQSIIDGVPLLIDDYCDLVDKASSGDPGAAGGVIYESAILIVPECDMLKAEVASVKAEGVVVKADAASVKATSLVEESSLEVVEKGKNKTDFIVTPEGVTVPTSQSVMREGFDKAGFPSAPTTKTSEEGIIHSVPTKGGNVDVRTMEGSGKNPKRAIFTQSGNNNPVKVGGEKFKGKVSKQEVREQSHLTQKN